MRWYSKVLGIAFAFGITAAIAQNLGPPGGGGGGAPSGAAGGDLSGTYPNPGVAQIGGVAPAAGVATALGITTGSAGSFVVNGGALGTPLSGVGTNLTGTAASLTAGHVTTNANQTGDCTSIGNATTCTKTSGVAFTGAATATYISAGSWTPTDNSGASLTFNTVSAGYTQIGNMIFAYATLTYPGTANGSTASITGLPLTVPNQGYAEQCTITDTNVATLAHMKPTKNTITAAFLTSGGVGVLNSVMSGSFINFTCVYPAT